MKEKQDNVIPLFKKSNDTIELSDDEYNFRYNLAVKIGKDLDMLDSHLGIFHSFGIYEIVCHLVDNRNTEFSFEGAAKALFKKNPNNIDEMVDLLMSNERK